MKLKLVYVSLLLGLQAAHAIAQSDALNTQDSLAKNITNLETENVIGHFANKPVDAETKLTALLMAQKQLAEKKSNANWLYKSSPDMWRAINGSFSTGFGLGFIYYTHMFFKMLKMVVIPVFFEMEMSRAKGEAARKNEPWDETIEKQHRRTNTSFFNAMHSITRNFFYCLGGYGALSGIKNLITGFKRTDAQEKLRKATAIEFFLRTMHNKQKVA